jgi:hypothetical protein
MGTQYDSIETRRENLDDGRKDIRFINSNYKTLFNVKDGDSIKITSGYDGEVKTLKCRHINEMHIQLIGKYRNDYHICQFAEIMERNGSKYEPIPGQKPMIDILSAKYGEPLKDMAISMTEAAIRKLAGGKYAVEPLNESGDCVIARGAAGVVVCGHENGTLTSIHPYWAQKYKHELGAIEPPKKPSLLKTLEKTKAEAAKANVANRAGQKRTKDASCL